MSSIDLALTDNERMTIASTLSACCDYVLTIVVVYCLMLRPASPVSCIVISCPGCHVFVAVPSKIEQRSSGAAAAAAGPAISNRDVSQRPQWQTVYTLPTARPPARPYGPSGSVYPDEDLNRNRGHIPLHRVTGCSLPVNARRPTEPSTDPTSVSPS